MTATAIPSLENLIQKLLSFLQILQRKPARLYLDNLAVFVAIKSKPGLNKNRAWNFRPAPVA